MVISFLGSQLADIFWHHNMVVREANAMQLPIPEDFQLPILRILPMQVVIEDVFSCQSWQSDADGLALQGRWVVIDNVSLKRWARLARKVLILLMYRFQFSARGLMLKEWKKLRA